ncbi:unnamed protein product [Durusdinium trenchii]|uniref:Uncharacterized protein n=1 Tax=Durusdinium trenchii TaxID=1381693 RepID=A0ABP0HJ46_9DINO
MSQSVTRGFPAPVVAASNFCLEIAVLRRPRRSQLQEVTKILLEARKKGAGVEDAWQRFHALGDPEVEEVLHRMGCLDDGEHQASLRSELLAKLRRARVWEPRWFAEKVIRRIHQWPCH